MNSEIIEKIVEELPVMDSVAQQIITIINDENTTASKLESLIKKDSVLTLKILKLANSTYFSPMKPITTVAHAIRYVGFSTLKSLVYSIALQSIGNSKGKGGEEIKYLHRKSLANAAVSMIIGRSFFKKNRSLYSPEDYYTFSLFHDIGLIALANYDIDKYLDIKMNVVKKDSYLTDIENEFPHSEIGLVLMEKWKIPQIFSEFTKEHHNLQDHESKYYVPAKLTEISEHLCFIMDYDVFAKRDIDVIHEMVELNIDPTEYFDDQGELKDLKEQVEDILGSIIS
ncbi:MAG: HDOD domain-containing protein [Candidatus Delongbacteria bacterium]|nr:HDOD domain-containing protein [Candidatus Delongbacteria bacterium]MBN2834036.1 HDOD domain-containing protein [Candidatus Delongbacteria bacterium]